jgi:hypothetical protein
VGAGAAAPTKRLNLERFPTEGRIEIDETSSSGCSSRAAMASRQRGVLGDGKIALAPLLTTGNRCRAMRRCAALFSAGDAAC